MIDFRIPTCMISFAYSHLAKSGAIGLRIAWKIGTHGCRFKLQSRQYLSCNSQNMKFHLIYEEYIG